jgi:hypothetical protein
MPLNVGFALHEHTDSSESGCSDDYWVYRRDHRRRQQVRDEPRKEESAALMFT